MSIGRAIRTIRSAQGLRQDELALKVGCDPSYVSLVESDDRGPSRNMVKRFAVALGIREILLLILADPSEPILDGHATEIVRILRGEEPQCDREGCL